MKSSISDGSKMHAGHRQRMKRVYLKNRYETFEEHEILEFLLFFAIPYRDTNPLAHMLISRFGSLRGVFDASVEELESVEGIGRSSAIFLKAYSKIGEVFCAPSTESRPKGSTIISGYREACEYIKKNYASVDEDFTLAIMMNNSHEIIKVIEFPKKRITSSSFNVNAIAVDVLAERASCIIIAQWQSGFLARPIVEEQESASAMMEIFSCLGIVLSNVIVFTSQDCASAIGREE